MWAFRLVFADPDQQFVWETLLGVVAPGPCSMLNVQCAGLKAEGSRRETDRRTLLTPAAWIAWSATQLAPMLAIERQKALDSLAASLKAPFDLALRREHAIAAALTAERARLSAALLQPSLFDHRAERSLAAQSAVVDEALERCRVRIEEIARTGRLVVERQRLAFAVIHR